MENNGIIHGNLDPRAQEFIPTYPFNNNFLPVFPNQFYYPFSCPPPHPPPPPPPPPYADVAPVPLLRPAYLSANPPVPTPILPPPSSMSTRTLLLCMVPVDVSESIIRRDLEVFGDVRAVQMGRVREGIVTVHFYDLRNAQTALMEIQQQHMQQQMRLRRHYYEFIENQNSIPPVPPPTARGLIAGKAVWAQFTFPVTSALVDGNNQGTLVIFNLSPQTSADSLFHLFQAFGHVKELRETPMKKHQRFVEFYDVRDASRALMGMNGYDLNGQPLLIEFSRPGGNNSRRFSKGFQYSSPTKFNNNYSPPRIAPVYNTSPSRNQKSNYVKGNPSGCSGSESSGTGGSVQESFASLCISNNSNVRIGKNKNARKSNHHNISASSSSVTSCSPKRPQKLFQQQANSSSSSSSRPWKMGWSSKQAKDYDPRFLIKEDAIMESNCRDSRTTVMIKNIPNKYSQKLLLNMLDNHCIHCNEQIADGDDQPKSSYDFVYLPIDFINKCNVGYGFVNMTSPQATLRLYKAFHLQNWEVFNSRKICQVTYARLQHFVIRLASSSEIFSEDECQGIEALKDHFKNSKFPCEAEEYMPVIFSPPRDGKCLTEPNPIVGCGIINTSSSNSCHSNDENEETAAGRNGGSSSSSSNSNGENYNVGNDDSSTFTCVRMLASSAGK